LARENQTAAEVSWPSWTLRLINLFMWLLLR